MRSWRAATIVTALALVHGLVPSASTVQQPPATPAVSPWAEWIEPDFPFFSSVLDAGRAGPGLPTRNLTPRGLIVNLGQGHWVGFDTDLLRVAAVWRGNAVTPKALAPGSYHEPDRKTQGGQSPPEPDGKVWAANGIYPGWQAGARPSLDDPREPAPTVEEVGRGPVSDQIGRFGAVRLVRGGVVLEYTVRGSDVREWMTVASAGGRSAIVRNVQVGPAAEPLWLMAGFKSKEGSISVCPGTGTAPALESIAASGGSGEPALAVKVPPHSQPVQFCVAMSDAPFTDSITFQPIPTATPSSRWAQEVTTTVTASTAKDAYVVDDFSLPVGNPWRRNVRPGDIQFLKDGTGAVVTLDGDVWLVRGLHQPGAPIKWKRFTSGLHEPLSLAIKDEQIHVFDRNGIWRLRDTNGDGEADVHELFSNAFAQTADNREFPSTLRLAPNGEFVIAKGGQEATTIGKHNGSVLRVSADGRSSTVLGYGFRQPQIGVNVRTGLVTSSDQQGHYIPTTPLHIVRDRQFYGFLSDKLPREVYPAPIADPLTWIPHAVNASAMSQVWLFDAKMGPLNDGLVHIGFNKPELFRVMLNNRGAKPQAAVVSVTQAFEFPPLNGSVNPADGQLYLTGFQVLGWGTTSPRLAGLGRDSLHRRTIDAPERSRADGQGAVDPVRQRARREAGDQSEQLHRGELALRAHLQVRIAAAQSRRHAGRRSTRTDERVPLEGWEKRLHRTARDQARDADACRLDTGYGRWRALSRERGVHALRTCDVQPREGRVRRPDSRSRAEDGRRTRGDWTSQRGRGTAGVRAFRVHRLPRARGVGDLEARSKLQGALRIGPHVQ